jgi:hypothetical protein
MFKSAYGEEFLSTASVSEWHKRFKEGKESLRNAERKSPRSTSRREELT